MSPRLSTGKMSRTNTSMMTISLLPRPAMTSLVSLKTSFPGIMLDFQPSSSQYVMILN